MTYHPLVTYLSGNDLPSIGDISDWKEGLDIFFVVDFLQNVIGPVHQSPQLAGWSGTVNCPLESFLH